MSVVLLILKIIGILLLAVLGLVLLILFSLLLAPVRYRIRASSEPGLSLYASFRWLFPLVKVSLGYEDRKLTQKLQILGIPISLGGKVGEDSHRPPRKKKKKAPRKQKSARETEEARQQGPAQEPEEVTQPRSAQEPEKATQPRPAQEPEEGRQQGPAQEPEAIGLGPGREAVPAGRETAGQEDTSEKGRSKPGRVGALFGKVKALARMIKEKVAKLKEILRRILQEIRDETNQNVLRLLFREGKALLGHYLPRRLKADVRFGMADPAATGQLLGVLSLFPVFLRPGVLIAPDFMAEKIYVDGSFEMCGHVRAVHVLVAALHLWREQDVKKLIQRVRNRR